MKNIINWIKDYFAPSAFKGATTALLALSLLTVTTLPATGCSTAQTVQEVNVVLTEASNILAVADPGAAWVPQFKAAVATLQTADTGWVAGGAVQDVTEALNAVVAITAVIPVTAVYSPLIDVLVAGIEAVLAALPAPTPAVAQANAAKGAFNPYVGKVVIKHHLFHNRVDEFKTAWNSAAAQSGLKTAVLQ
jgi:hypothetical protein